jgi:hypothetical protein
MRYVSNIKAERYSGMPESDSPYAWLKISPALAKHLAKKLIGEEALEVSANTLKINNGIL